MADNTLDELSSLPVDYRRHPMAMGMGHQQVQPMQTPEWLVEGMGNVNLGAAPPRSRSYRGGSGGGGSAGEMVDPADPMAIPTEGQVQAELEQANLEEQMGMSMEGGMSMETLPPAPMPQIGEAAPAAPPALADTSALVSPYPAYRRELTAAKGAADEAEGKRFEADKAMADAEKLHQEDIQKKENDRARELANRARDLKAQQVIDAESRAQATQKIQRATQMVMDKTIDPRRLLPTMSAKMGAALAVGLGQFGATLTGTQNAALQMLETAIDRDIAAQQVDLENLKFGVEMAQTEYSMLLDEIQDRRQVNNIIHQLGLEQFEFSLRQMATKFNIESHDARLKQLEAASAARRTKLDLELKQMNYAAAWQNYALNRQIEAQKEAAALANRGGKPPEFRPKIQEKLTYAKLAEGQIAELEADVDQTTFGEHILPWYSASEKYQDNLKGLASTLVRMYSGAAATNEEAERIASRLGGGFTLEGTKRSKLGEVKQEMQIMKAALYESMSGPEQALFYSRFGDPRVGLIGNELPIFMAAIKGERDAITTPSAAIAKGIVLGPAE